MTSLVSNNAVTMAGVYEGTHTLPEMKGISKAGTYFMYLAEYGETTTKKNELINCFTIKYIQPCEITYSERNNFFVETIKGLKLLAVTFENNKITSIKTYEEQVNAFAKGKLKIIIIENGDKKVSFQMPKCIPWESENEKTNYKALIKRFLGL